MDRPEDALTNGYNGDQGGQNGDYQMDLPQHTGLIDRHGEVSFD